MSNAAWVRDGTALAESTVDRLADEELAGPCGLPGWTRAHLVTHLARNADALVNLTVWARTGVPRPMYSGPAQRAADIEAGATRPAAAIRADLRAAGARLAEALGAMGPGDWAAQVLSAQGREIPARTIPWLRARELWIHAVDLVAGTGFDDFPAELLDALLDDVTGSFASRDGCPSARLSPTDRTRSWLTGPAAAEPVQVYGPAAQLARWLVGRGVDEAVRTAPGGGPPPALPVWL